MSTISMAINAVVLIKVRTFCKSLNARLMSSPVEIHRFPDVKHHVHAELGGGHFAQVAGNGQPGSQQAQPEHGSPELHCIVRIASHPAPEPAFADVGIGMHDFDLVYGQGGLTHSQDFDADPNGQVRAGQHHAAAHRFQESEHPAHQRPR
jgi:hypothetical protein